MSLLHSMRVTPGAQAVCLLVIQILACVETSTGTGPERGAAADRTGSTQAPRAATALIMTWNVTWFQSPDRPPDDAQQYAIVRDVLAEQAPTVVALQELSSDAAFERLLADLALSGVLSGYAWVQKTALLWDAERFELVHARSVFGLRDAQRPPLEVRLRSRDRAAQQQQLLLVVVHAKAGADAASYAQRVEFARGLKHHLDREHSTGAIILLGDFNDRLIGSLLPGMASPYQPFLDDAAYAAPTAELDQTGTDAGSFVTGESVDHIVLDARLAHRLQGSAKVLRHELLTRYPGFVHSVSDHFPVVVQLAP